MSMPKFPTNAGNITKNNAINQILSSIAMEELGLSHILNTEGEKLQYILGTLDSATPLTVPPTLDQVLQTNDSVQKTLDTVLAQQMFLSGKMSNALDAAASIIPLPNITIGPNGDWVINGVDTSVSALGDITIGPNGNWFINGIDTTVPAAGPQGPAGPNGVAPVVTIGLNKNWFINGVDTGQSSVPTMSTVLSVGANGNWFIDGVDSGVPVMGMLSVGANGNWFIDGVDTGTHAQGPTGAVGATGLTGSIGPTGPTGTNGVAPNITIGANGDWFVNGVDTTKPAQGPVGPGAIIPFASGLPAAVAILPLGLAGIPEFIGFGMSFPGVSALGTNIDFTGGTLTNFAFNVPRNGYISDIAATFQVVLGASLGLQPTFYLYIAPAGSSQYTDLSGTTLTLPSIDLVAVGSVVHGSLNGINVPVSAGDQLLFVAAATSSIPLVGSGGATGYISGGVSLVYV